MKLVANAKINIGLSVGAKRADGYHDIETVMALISLCDTIEADVYPSEHTEIIIEGNESYLGGKIDLMEKAARFYSEISGWKFSLHLKIEKNIPVMAGLGGGSSDAATVLSYLDSLSPRPFGRERLVSVSQAIGSDVPFFVSGFKGAYVTGRGEVVREDEVPSGASVLLFFPSGAVSTLEAYRKLDSIEREIGHIKPLCGRWPEKKDYPNHFELVLSRCAQDVMPSEVIASGTFVSLTGSGSAWYALFSPEKSIKFDNPEKYGIVSACII